jgi:hypothetical protein
MKAAIRRAASGQVASGDLRRSAMAGHVKNLRRSDPEEACLSTRKETVRLPLMTPARWCRQLRRSRRYTLATVSRHTKISIAYLNELEKGVKKNPSFRIRHALAAFYGAPFPTGKFTLAVRAASLAQERCPRHR